VHSSAASGADERQRGGVVSEVVGTVDQVSVYPVKSLAGRTVAEARVESAGLVGDRAGSAPATRSNCSPDRLPALRALTF
jgi:hypothetical protein